MSESSTPPLSIEPPIPHLLADADQEELGITLGLGLLARRAAETEYILHGIYVHLVEAERAYTQLAVATGGTLVRQCKEKLEASTLPASCKSSLAEDLDEASAAFAVRNRYLHGYWIYDEESYQWLTVKGARGMDRPEITFIGVDEVWEQADRLGRLCARLLHWDTAHFGEPSQDNEDGPEGLVSTKRI